MLQQFSFGHLQSTDVQVCAASELVRENDSIQEKSADLTSLSGVPPYLLQIDSQMGISQQASAEQNTQNLTVPLNQDLTSSQVPYTSNPGSEVDKQSLYQHLFQQVRAQLDRQT